MRNILLIFFCGLSTIAFSQAEKGQILIGGNADMSLSFQSDVRSFNLLISPAFGVFAVKHLVIGGRYSFGVTSRRAFNTDKQEYRSVTGFTTGIGPLVKYYFGKKQLKGFVSANAAYQVFTQLTKGNVANKNGFTAGGALGMAYFFNAHVGLETAFYVNASGYEGDFPVTRGGFSVGIFTVLDKKKSE